MHYLCITLISNIKYNIKLLTELFIAKRLQLNATGDAKRPSPSLAIATFGIVLAITIMLLSLAIVSGFKAEIAGKIYSLDSHIKITNAALGLDNNIYTVHGNNIFPLISNSNEKESIANMALIAEQPVILKTQSDFKGIVFKGVDANFDWTYLKNSLVAGRLPSAANSNEVLISQKVASQLGLSVGDKVSTYFCNQKIKARRTQVAGIFKTDLEDFDSGYLIGAISLLQSVNNWDDDEGNYVGITVNRTPQIDALSYSLFSNLAQENCTNDSKTIYNVNNTNSYNATFFSWLSLLDMNVVIIIVLMAIVSGFTLISALLMIVLERIKMIGLLKTLGATNTSIRLIFISLTQKIIIKAIIWGNVLGLAIAYAQKHFHLIHLDAEAYYMPYVPIEIDWLSVILLNVAIIIVAYATLIGPSHIISNVKPSTTLRFE